MAVRVPLPVNIETTVSLDYITDGESGVIEATIIGFCMYEGEVITTTILTSCGAIFDHIPLNVLGGSSLELKQTYTMNITKGEWEVCYYRIKGDVSVKGVDGKWSYVLTLDNVSGNESYNLLVNDCGVYILRPNYQMFVGCEPTGRVYRKVEDIINV